MTSNSATIFENKKTQPYSDSGGNQGMDWIQLPINQQVFSLGGPVLDGIYVQSTIYKASTVLTTGLDLEFSAWDAASDEALINFERESM